MLPITTKQVKGYPFRSFKSMRLEFDICQTKLRNQFFISSVESLTYYKNGKSSAATYRALRGDYGLHIRPTTQAIAKL